MTGDAAVRALDRYRGGASPADVLALADRLPGVGVDDLVGRWRGAELPTGSPLDGLLSAYRWWGKEVVDAETVHPLLFCDRAGRPRPMQPAVAPLTLLRRAPGLVRSRPARPVGEEQGMHGVGVAHLLAPPAVCEEQAVER